MAPLGPIVATPVTPTLVYEVEVIGAYLMIRRTSFSCTSSSFLDHMSSYNEGEYYLEVITIS